MCLLTAMMIVSLLAKLNSTNSSPTAALQPGQQSASSPGEWPKCWLNHTPKLRIASIVRHSEPLGNVTQ